MKQLKNVFLFLIASAFSFSVHAADVAVSATVDRNEMSEGDTFTLTVSISSDSSFSVADPRLPDMSKFDLINTWKGVESQSTFSNGNFQVRRTQKFNYMLAPKTRGQLSIESIPVIVDGVTYNTKPLTIAVLETDSSAPNVAQRGRRGTGQQLEDDPNGVPQEDEEPMAEADDLFNQLLQRHFGGQRPGARPQPPVNAKDSFFIQAQVDKTSVFVGEQVTASFYLYTRGQIRDIDTLKYPSLKGFWKEDIDVATRLNFTNEVINGIVYNKALLASYALFPIKAGTSAVDPYRAKCTVMAPSNFGFGQPAQFTKESKQIPIQVKAVPSEGMPKDFAGAVGKFQLTANLDSNTVQANQPVTLKVRFEGTGNAKLIELPPMQLPRGVELYDTKKDSKFFANGTSYKQFEVLLIPREPGEIVIPPVSVSLFNPATQKFYTLTAQEMKLNVTPGTGNEILPSKPLAKNSDAPVQEAGPSLPAPALKIEDDSWFTAGQTAAAWSLSFLMVFGLVFWRFAKDGQIGYKTEKTAHQVLNARFKKIHAFIDQQNWRSVGTEMVNTVYYVLQETTGREITTASLDQLFEQVPPSVRRQWEKQVRDHIVVFESLGFAPESLLGDLKNKEQVKKHTQSMQKILEGIAKTGWTNT